MEKCRIFYFSMRDCEKVQKTINEFLSSGIKVKRIKQSSAPMQSKDGFFPTAFLTIFYVED